MPAAVAEQISLFRSFIEKGSYSDVSLRILETLLVAKDVRSLFEIRSTLQELLRSEVTSVMARIAAKSADEKLDIAEFFVKAFALVGDVKSCLALKYEALVLRESKYCNNDDFRVSYQEWYTFAKDSLHNRYYSIAVKGFDSALSCFQSEHNIDGVTRDNHMNDHIVDKIIRLRDEASAMVSSRSGMVLNLALERLVNEKLLSLHAVADRYNDPQTTEFIESQFLEEQAYVTQLRRVGKGHGVRAL